MNNVHIYDYLDYRDFIRECIALRKKADAKYSLSTFAAQLNVSLSVLSDTLNYRRDLSQSVLAKIANNLGLYGSELSFFKYLVALCDGKTVQQKAAAFQKLTRLKGYQNRHPEDIKAQTYLSSWLNLAIREMAQFPDFRAEVKWIRSRLKFKAKPTEIKDALNFLFKEGYIEDIDGKIRPQDKAIHCHRNVQRLALAKIHEEFMGLAQESIYNTDSTNRDLNTYVLGLRPTEFKRVKEIIAKAINEIRALSSEEREKAKSEEVYYLSLFAFPLTRDTSTNDGSAA